MSYTTRMFVSNRRLLGYLATLKVLIENIEMEARSMEKTVEREQFSTKEEDEYDSRD